jgi:prolyl-tRNA synthetase
MRFSKLFSRPQKGVPKEEDSISGRLLVRAGFIHKLASGSYDLLPLGFRVFKKIEGIIREELNKIGAEEILSPVVQPASLWQKSGRLKDFGAELVVFTNRHKQKMVLAPTHEETIANMGQKFINSYQDMPVLVNQFQTKYRDEPRPRSGLLRVREFIMQDGYSFDRDRKGLDKSYQAVRGAYSKIFKRCGLKALIVDSDVGAMGGYGGEEFILPNNNGEDRLIVCPKGDYQANVDIALFQRVEKRKKLTKLKKLVEVKTPQAKTIKELCQYLDIKPSQTAKMVFYLVADQLIAVIVRGDLEVSQIKLANLLKAQELIIAPLERVSEAGAVPGFANPNGVKAKLIVDPSVAEGANLVIGANRKNYHLRNFNLKRDFKGEAKIADIAEAQAGLPCPKCGAKLREEKGIELGHIFKLGQKYSKSMGVVFTDQRGKEKLVEMGCYGIGLGRLMAATVEHYHDRQGIIWPDEIAPYQFQLIVLGQNKKVTAQAEKLYHNLQGQAKEVLFDDRDESAGVKFNDADLIGIPKRLVVSEKTIKEGKVELNYRSREPGQEEKGKGKLVDPDQL